MEYPELTFLQKMLKKARKLGFQTSVEGLTKLIGVQDDQPPGSRLQGNDGGKSSDTARSVNKRPSTRLLVEYPFASSEQTLVGSLQSKGILTRTDLVNALVRSGLKEKSVLGNLAQLLNRKHFAAAIASSRPNMAKAVYQLAGLAIPAVQPAVPPSTSVARQHAAEPPPVPAPNPKVLTKGRASGLGSRPLTEFAFARQEAPLVAALAKAGITSRVQLIEALTDLGRKRFTVEVALVQLLRLPDFSAELSKSNPKGTLNIAKSIYQIAGLAIPVPIEPEPRRASVTRSPSASSAASPAPRHSVFKSRLLGSFPFAYGAPALIEALAARQVVTKSDLLAVMKKRKLDTSGLSKFLDGHITISRGATEGYSASAHSVAAIARLSCDTAFGSGPRNGRKAHPLSLPNGTAVQQIGHPEAASGSVTANRSFTGYRLATIAPTLTEALAGAGLASETDLQTALQAAGVGKRKAATAVEQFLNGSVLGIIQHQAGSTSVGRFFCDRTGIPFARILPEISNPAPVPNGHQQAIPARTSDPVELPSPAAPDLTSGSETETVPPKLSPVVLRKGFASNPLINFPFTKGEAPLVTALAEMGVISRVDLLTALVETGWNRDSVDNALTRLLRLKDFSAELVSPRKTIAKSIYQLAGLAVPVAMKPVEVPQKLGRPVSNDHKASPRILTSHAAPFQPVRVVSDDVPPVVTSLPGSGVRSKGSSDPFENGLLQAMPKMRIQALTLTRNRSAADDLVQQAIANALCAHRERNGFIPQPDTPYQKSLERWLHTVMRNAFISGLRKSKSNMHISLWTEDDKNESLVDRIPVRERQEDLLEVQQLSTEIQKLSPEHKHALLRVAIHGDSYEQLAEDLGVAAGTAKSKVFRARSQLRTAMSRPKLEV